MTPSAPATWWSKLSSGAKSAAQDELRRAGDGLVELSHTIHAHPELAFEEFETAGVVREELDRLKIKYVAGVENAPTAQVGGAEGPHCRYS